MSLYLAGNRVPLQRRLTLSGFLFQQVGVQSQVTLFVTQRFDPLLLLGQLVGRVPRPAVVLGEVV